MKKKICCSGGNGRHTLIFLQKCLAAGLAVTSKNTHAVQSGGRADGGGCPCVSVSG